MQSQANTTQPEVETPHQERGTWQTYDATDGLPGGVRCLLQDRYGYLWFGTGLGLCRYNGTEFLTYTTKDGLASNRIGCICEDHRGRLWFAAGRWKTMPGWGVTCFDGENFTTYTTQEGLSGNDVQSIATDHQHRLWFGTADGLTCFDGERCVGYTTDDGLADNDICSICIDSRKRLWLGTPGRGVTCVDGQRLTTYTTENGLSDNHINSIHEDSEARIWFATQNGVTCFDGDRFTVYRTEDGLSDNHVWSIYEYCNKNLWFGTWNGGVCCLDDGEFISYTVQDGLLGNAINDIIEDREGQLWFADSLAGLTCFDIETVEQLTDVSVTEVLIQDRKGRLWFSHGRFLYGIDGQTQRQQAFSTHIYSLLEDSAGHFWVATWGDGVYRYPSADAVWTEEAEHFTIEDGLNTKLALSIIESKHGTIWVGTGHAGALCRFNCDAEGKGRFEAIATSHSILSQLFEDSRGRIWMGGWEDNLLSCYDAGQIRTYTAEDGLLGNGVQTIFEDDAGKLWVGTDMGLYRLHENSPNPLRELQGLPRLQHQCMTQDTTGQLWFGTLIGGLYRYDGTHFQKLTTDDGLPSNSITGLLPQPDGSMIIGTYRGIVHYRSTATHPPQIQIEEVVADDIYRDLEAVKITAVGVDNTVPLLTISYHGLSFATHQMRYSYILEGYNTHWQGTWENQVRYEDLPPGEYIFKVIAINRDFVKSETPATLKINITSNHLTQLRAAYEVEVRNMRQLLNFNHLANSQETLSDAARVIVEGLREFGFDRAGTFIGEVGQPQIAGLWGTDLSGNIYKNTDEFQPADHIPPANGYYVVAPPKVFQTRLEVDASEIFLHQDQDEEMFEAIWGYAPPHPGYYQRDERGDNIALCVSTNNMVGIIAVDNFLTQRPIDETAANILALVCTRIAPALTNIALHESLAQSEARLRMVVTSAPIVLWALDRDGVFTLSEGKGLEVLGLKPGEVVGRSVFEVYRDFPQILEDSRRALAGETFTSIVDLGELEFEAHYVPIRDENGEVIGVTGVANDITERRQAEEALRKRENLYRYAIAQADAVPYQRDHQAESFTFIGEGIEDLTDYPAEEVTPALLDEITEEVIMLGAAEELPVDEAIRRARSGDLLEWRNESRILTRSGETRWIADSSVEIREADGNSIGSIGILQDITKHKQAEENLRNINRQLEETLAELTSTQQQIIQQERLRALGQMASGITHDFNNALSPVLGFSELLLERPKNLSDPEKVVCYLEMIRSSAKDAAATVRRLREFYRPREIGEIARPVDLAKLVEETIPLTQPKWKNQAQVDGVTIQIETKLKPVPEIAGVETELREVLTNLIFNAVDAMEEDGTITLSTSVDGGYALLEVSDTGIGMTEDVYRRCLEPFFSTKGTLGTGLGLAIVFGIIQRHAGKIEIDSQPNQGTTFRIRFPIKTERDESTTQPPAAVMTPNAPLRVLVVEDEPFIRQLMTSFLTGDGHTVETAANGREGLDKFHAGRFELVITDGAMPQMSGERLAAAIKQLSPRTPIILLTGFGDMMQADDEQPVGVDTIMSKPFTLEKVRETMAKVLKLE